MDKLQELFRLQKQFTNHFLQETHGADLDQIQDPRNEEEKLDLSKEYVLSIMKETSELLEHMNWKMHTKKNSDELDNRENFLEDAIDVLKYTLGLLILNGYQLHEIENKFITKSRVVEKKYDQNLSIHAINMHPEHKVAVIDIDGVLNQFPRRFLEYTWEITGAKYKCITEFKQKDIKGYRRLKDMYRKSGEKKNTYPNNEAAEFTHKLRKKNYYIILLTSRPYNKYYNIFDDTIEWLKDNNIAYDLIVWEENKAEYIIENLNKIEFAVDDDIELCNLYQAHGIKTYYKINRGFYESMSEMNEDIFRRLNNNIQVVYTLYDIKT